MIYEPKGELVINIISKIKEDIVGLVDNMSENDALVIDLSSVDNVDITFIQLLYAVNKYMKEKNLTLKIQNPSDEVLSSLIYGGFLTNLEGVDQLDLGQSLVDF